MVKVVWSNLAIDDLKAIHDYISRDSKIYASKFVARIIARVDQLEQHPMSGRIVPEFESESIRELIEGNYRIVYKIYADHLGIARVFHSARQLKQVE